MRRFPIAALAVVALAQTPASFEAASIKPLKIPDGPFHFTVLPNRLDVRNLSLAYLIRQAYDVQVFQLSAPDAVFQHTYDVLATSGAPVSRAEMRVMLQSLLRERFHLVTHWEDQTKAIFRLVVMPGGPKMKSVEQGYAMGNSPMRDGNSLQFGGPMSLRQLADSLARYAGKPVLDATGIDGYFNFSLTFAPDDVDPTKEVTAATLPKALEEQLGLKLVAAKEPVRMLIVDHADTVPTEN